MSLSFAAENLAVSSKFLSGGGEMGQRIREFDWSKNPLGSVSTWPQSLRSALSICLNSNFPIAIYWGNELTLIYNDAWSSIPGNKHPNALGHGAKEVWPEIWDAIEPQFQKTFAGLPGGSKDALLLMQRHGYTEECYFDFTFTPVYGEDGKVDGVFNAVIETTYRVINERRTAFLKNFALQLASAQTSAEVFDQAINLIGKASQDIPFALIYSFENNEPYLKHSTIEKNSLSFINPWPFDVVKNSGQSYAIECIKKYVSPAPKIYWEEEVTEALILPLKTHNKLATEFLVCGISARRRFDADYKVFLESVASAMTTVINTIHSLEEQRKKAEALAEVDKAKTTFFSNISHEFRTPLTLILGPIEDALNDPNTIPENKVRMDVAFRNALRMQKLVNTLLDFSRIEADRMEGKFSKVDICSLTKELASTFRSAIEKAGLQLKFECDTVLHEVYADVDMWEKIVLNLISNAFKYSKRGVITIRIKEIDDKIQLSVCDTGVGIPEDQLDKVFDRFHRVENIQGRSQEGTGIGLAMVKELVRLHQGSIEVESELGKGSTFTVSIPSGKEHLAEEKIINTPASVSHHASEFVQEAMKWSDDAKNNKHIVDSRDSETFLHYKNDKKYTVVLADDNADMRDYVKRLLSDQFRVITAVDGEDAFSKITNYHPDLLLSDIMMPGLDGFGLLQRVRNHPDLKSLPVILLSARAGEEAKVEGLEAGADDYLVKPFSAKELLARVDANIKIAMNRLAAESNLRHMIRQSPVATVMLKSRSMIIEIVNEKGLELWGRSYEEVINLPIAEALPEIAEQGFTTLLEQVFDTGKTFNGNEIPVELKRFGQPEIFYLNFIYQPLKNEAGESMGVIGVAINVTEQVLARKKIEQSQKELNELANAVPQLVWVAEGSGQVIYYNDRVNELAGATRKKNGTWIWEALVHPDDLIATEHAWQEAVKTGGVYQIEHRVQMKNGEYRWFLSRAHAHRDENANVIKWFGSATDIHVSKTHSTILEEEVKKRTKELNELNLSLMRSNHELQQFAHVASHDLKEPVRKIKTFTSRLMDDEQSSFSENAKLYLKKVNSAADRMNIMIEGVLNYSMLNEAQQKTEQVDLNEIFRNIESDLELSISQKKAAINHQHLPEVEGASVLLYQLFYNLINNSLKFSKPGEAPVINVTSVLSREQEKDIATIILQDNGIGFEQEFAKKIFETFLRLNSKDQFEGTGLGLSLCKRIAERHGGSIEAFGVPGEGSRFIIHLPIKQEKRNI